MPKNQPTNQPPKQTNKQTNNQTIDCFISQQILTKIPTFFFGLVWAHSNKWN